MNVVIMVVEETKEEAEEETDKERIGIRRNTDN